MAASNCIRRRSTSARLKYASANLGSSATPQPALITGGLLAALVIVSILSGDPAEADVRLEPGQFLLPGLVDLHIHAPQWPQLGKALDVPLGTVRSRIHRARQRVRDYLDSYQDDRELNEA